MNIFNLKRLVLLFAIIGLTIALPTISFSQCQTPTTSGGSNCGTGVVNLTASGNTGPYYWFDKASEGVFYSKGNAFTTPVLNSTDTFYIAEINTGTTNDALTFDGTDDYVAIQGKHYSNVGEISQITIEAWVKTSFSSGTWTANWAIVDFDRSEYFSFYVNATTGAVGFATTDNNGGVNDFNGTTVVNDGTWHHIAAVYDGTDKRIFVDGVLDATSSNPHSGRPLGKGTVTRYGFLGDGSEADVFDGTRNYFYYTGDIDEVRVWNSVRTVSEINNNKNNCLSLPQTNLDLYYRMDGNGTTLTDYSGNGYNGVLKNMSGSWNSTGPSLSSCPSCESSRAMAIATINKTPSPNLGGGQCIASNSYTLNPGNGYSSYLWQDASTNNTYNVTTTGTYSVKVDSLNLGCYGYDTVNITLAKTPLAHDTSVCGSGAYELSVAGGSGNYKWYDAPTGGNYIGAGSKYVTQAVSSTTNYYVSSYEEVNKDENLELDGNNDYLAIQNMNYSSSQTTLTVEAWINTTDGGDQIIASFDRSEYWRLEINGEGAGTGQIGFDITTDAGILDFGGTTTINDGSWHHVAAVYDNGSVKIYIDGTLDASTTYGTNFGTGITRYGMVGTGSEAPNYNGTTGPASYYNGQIDELRIWNTARTQSQIQASINTCISPSENGLQLYYPFSDGSGTEAADYSINANNGSFQNINSSTAWKNNHPMSGCESDCESTRDNLLLTVNKVPKPNLGNDICVSSPLLLDAGSYPNYLWNTGATTQTITASSSGFYSVVVDSAGTPCLGTDGISVSVLIQPDGVDAYRCGPGTIDLVVNNANVNLDYYWYDVAAGGNTVGTGTTFTTPSLSSSTTYYVAEVDNTPSVEAISFDGTDDYIAIQNMVYNGTNYNKVTVEAWVKTTDGSDQIIASFDRSEYWRLEINGTGAGTGQVGFDIYTDAGQLDFGGTTRIDDGNWHHIAAVYNNGNAYIYIDGNLDATANLGTKFGTGIIRYGLLGVGSEADIFDGNQAPLFYFNGDLDEVRIWSSARNISEIQSYKDHCLSGSEASLEAYYKMENGSGSNYLTDHSNNGYNGTLRNMNVNTVWINTGQDIDCSCGESSRDAVSAQIDFIPNVNLGNDTCANTAYNLDAGSGFTSYTWQDASTNQTLLANTSKLYWVHVAQAGTQCIGGDSITVSVGTALPPLATDSTRCGAGMIDLKATSAASIKWWDQSVGGTLLGTGTSLTVGPLSSNTAYYMSSSIESTDALSFNGSSDYVAIQNKHYSTAGEISELTAEAWINTSFSGGGAYDNWSIVDFDRSEYYNMWIDGSNGMVSFSTTDNTGSTDDFEGTTSVNDGNWHHIAVVYNGTDKLIYVDGILDATKNNPHGGKTLGSGAFTRYGFIGDGSEADVYNGTRNEFNYNGDIDEVRIWNVSRSASEINNNKSVCLVGNETGLELYYRMDEGSGNSLTDYAGSNSATLYGANWINTAPGISCNSCGSSDRKIINATIHSDITSITTSKSCPGDIGSDLYLKATGGSGKYDYQETNGIFNYSGNYQAGTTTKLVNNGGSYNIEVKDENGCLASVSGVTTSKIPSQISTANGTNTGCILPQKNSWYYIIDASSHAIIALKSPNTDLGVVNANVYVDGNAGIYDGFAYMKRHYVVQAQNAPTASVSVRLYFKNAELTNLSSVASGTADPKDDISSVNQLGVTKYDGPSEDGNYDPTDATSVVYINQDNNGTQLGDKFIEISSSSFSEFWLHASTLNSALPIDLISFDLSKENNSVRIDWATASETNNDYFRIERTLDFRTIESVQTVKGAGNSSTLLNYSTFDDNPINGISYYRLVQVDFDGQEEVFDWKSVNFGENNESSLTVYPNPSKGGQAKIILLNVSGKTELNIMDMSGRIVFSKSLDLINVNNTIPLSLNLSAGVYFIQIINNDKTLKQRLIVK